MPIVPHSVPVTGPSADLDKHGNRKHAGMWPGGSCNHTSLSRRHFLDRTLNPFVPRTPDNQIHLTEFYKGQSLGVLSPKNILNPLGFDVSTDGYSPSEWPRSGRLPRVPKCVILSSFPAWEEMWDQCIFYAPNDVFELAYGEFTNYWQIEQWNVGSGQMTSERFHEAMGNAIGPYAMDHNALLDTFLKVKKTLESDPVDPIAVIIPDWMPRKVREAQSLGIGYSHWFPNPDRPWWANADPMYLSTPILNSPSYPDVNDSRNYSSFPFSGPAQLLTGGGGFATNVLHIYCGHNQINYRGSNSMFDFQSWPQTAEGLWIGPVFTTPGYLGNRHVNTFLEGRRNPWTQFSLAAGMSPGGQSIYNYYSGALVPAADRYKQGFYNHRNWATKLYTFPGGFRGGLDEYVIENDRKVTVGGQFHFGYSIGEWNAMFANDDYHMAANPDGPIGIAYDESVSFFPARSALDIGEMILRQLKSKITQYYTDLDPKTADFFQIMIAENELDKFGMEYVDNMSAILDPGDLIGTIRDHFKAFPS
jgi:hypothetical protein